MLAPSFFTHMPLVFLKGIHAKLSTEITRPEKGVNRVVRSLCAFLIEKIIYRSLRNRHEAHRLRQVTTAARQHSREFSCFNGTYRDNMSGEK